VQTLHQSFFGRGIELKSGSLSAMVVRVALLWGERDKAAGGLLAAPSAFREVKVESRSEQPDGADTMKELRASSLALL
jgi:hypothetical protein